MRMFVNRSSLNLFTRYLYCSCISQNYSMKENTSAVMLCFGKMLNLAIFLNTFPFRAVLPQRLYAPKRAFKF
jgi:hypothetical protein